MNSTLVSIIIPTYNRSHLIGQTLNSVLEQTYKNWECIVVDDGSIDYTDELLVFYMEKDSRIQYYHRPKNRLKGANACRNYGFERSKGEYLIFLDSDDFLLTECLKSRLRIFENYPTVDYVISNTGIFSEGQETERIINLDPNYNKRESYLTMFLSYRLPWPIMSVMWIRQVLIKFLFDEQLRRLQDVDFHVRILLSKKFEGKRIFNVDNFYRINNRDPENKLAHMDNVVYSFMRVQKKFISIFLKSEKSHFKKFIYFFLFRIMYAHPKRYKNEIIITEKGLIQNKYITKKHLYFLHIKRIIETSFLKKIRGMSKISSHLQSQIELEYK